MYSAGTNGHISFAWLPPQILYTSLIYGLVPQTPGTAYSSWQRGHCRNTAVLFGTPGSRCEGYFALNRRLGEIAVTVLVNRTEL